MYSPECFEQGIVQWDWDAMVNNPCYDVLSDASGESYWVEYIGCPEVPVTQEGTYAPLNWRDHVVPVKPASSQKAVSGQSKVSSTREARTSSLSTTNPYVVHRDSDNGRSQGLVVSESKRAESHAAATKVQAKLAAAEKAKKAANKRR